MEFRNAFEQIIVCAAASIPSLWFMYNYLNIPTKFFSMFLFTATIFSIIITYVFNQRINVILSFNSPSPRLLLLLIYMSCLLITLRSPSLSESVFVSLSSIGVVNWLRVVAGILLGIFLPGFCLMSLFEHKLNFISLLPISVLLSIFINTTIAFIAVAFTQPALTWMLLANVLIVSLSLVDVLHDKVNRRSLRSQSVSITLDNENILILLLSVFQLSILVSVFLLSGLTVPNGDMWRHASMATRIEKGGLLRFGLLVYPPYFPVHLFSVSQLTGMPVLNVSNILGLTNILIILAFYTLALTLTKKKTVAFLSTFVFTVFGSFTFMVQALLGKIVTDPQKLAEYFLETAGKTMQINSVYPLANIYAYAPVTLHFLSVLVLTSLLLQKDKTHILYAVEALLIANLFLLHVAETVYVLIFLLAALMLGLSSVKDMISSTLGVGLAGILFLTLPFVKSSITLYVVIVFTASLIFTLLITKLKPFLKMQQLFKKPLNLMSKRSIKAFLAFAILSLYGILLLIWKTVYIDHGNTWYGVLSYLGAAPTYFMPIVFGLPLVISVLYCAYYLLSKNSLKQKERKILTFLALTFIMAYLFGKAITLVNILGYMTYREVRVLSTFGGIAFSIVSGLALYGILKYFKYKYIKTYQKNILALGLGVLILLGSGSTLLSATLWSNRGMKAYPLSQKEAEALEFLKQTISPSDVVLAYSHESNTKAGLTGATTIIRHSEPFRSVSSGIPKVTLQVTDYIYLTKQDYNTIQKSNTYMRALMNILPVVFNNTEVMIFSVPLNVKRFIGNLSIPVVIGCDLKEALPKLAFLDTLGLSYRVYDEWDLGSLANNPEVILINDVENVSDAEKYVDWMQSGGHLVVLGGSEGYFSNLMQIRPRTKIIFQEEWLSEESFKTWIFDLRGGLKMSDVSISTLYEYQKRNSLLVNATKGGTFGVAYSRKWPRDFPFAIGTWFMLINNGSAIRNSMILMNGHACGVGLWDEDYSLDYYGGKQIIYDIVDISPQSWQKIELYFPDPETCYVYLNDTLVFVGPRSIKYDSPNVVYESEYKFTLNCWFVGRFQAVWNGLYYAAPDVTCVNGISCAGEHFSLGFKFNITTPKESFDKNVHVVSWYMIGDQKVAPFVFEKEIGKGKLTYVAFTPLLEVIPKLSGFSESLLKLIDVSLLSYMKQGGEIKFFPIDIYGKQTLNGSIEISSDTMYFSGSNATFSFEFSDGRKLFMNTSNIAFYLPYKFMLSLNSSVTVYPLHDEYVEILVLKGAEFTVVPCHQGNGVLSVLSGEDIIKLCNITKVITSCNSNLSIIMRSPSINLIGAATFEGGFFDDPYNQVLGSGTGVLTLHGKMVYNILISDYSSARCYGNQFTLIGTRIYDYPTIIQIELPNKLSITGQTAPSLSWQSSYTPLLPSLHFTYLMAKIKKDPCERNRRKTLRVQNENFHFNP